MTYRGRPLYLSLQRQNQNKTLFYTKFKVFDLLNNNLNFKTIRKAFFHSRYSLLDYFINIETVILAEMLKSSRN